MKRGGKTSSPFLPWHLERQFVSAAFPSWHWSETFTLTGVQTAPLILGRDESRLTFAVITWIIKKIVWGTNVQGFASDNNKEVSLYLLLCWRTLRLGRCFCLWRTHPNPRTRETRWAPDPLDTDTQNHQSDWCTRHSWKVGPGKRSQQATATIPRKFNWLSGGIYCHRF